MNTAKIIIGGLVAGLVMNILDFVTNAIVLGERWMSESVRFNMPAGSDSMSAMGWITVDFLMGIALVWVYAAIRPRFGAGPKTAMIASLIVWIIGHLMFASYVFNGFYSLGLVAACSIGGLIAVLAGGYVGGMLYKEGEA